MKKKLIIIGCIILFVGVILGVNTIFLSNSKDEIKTDVTILNKKEESHEEKKTFYAESIPKVDQEYTIFYDNVVISSVSTKSEVILDNITPSVDGEVIKLEDNFVKSESEVLKEEIIENSDNENTNELKTEEVISSDNNTIIETKEKTDSEESVKEFEAVKESDNDSSKEVTNETTAIQKEITSLKNGFYEEEGNTYYYENDIKVTGLRSINGVNNYFSATGKYLGTNNIKVVDVSYYQKDINWDLFASDSDCYGVILRLGYYETLDKKFEKNINELKRLNIPYGIYLFSYASTLNGAKKEADFTNKMITKYDINPSLGIYYDIESWSTKNSNSNNISKTMYDNIIQHYINSVSYYTNYKYKVKVYSGRWYAMNRFGNISKKYVDWVAEYNKTCKYDRPYSIWQYTSKGVVPGIEGNVDISYIL